MKLSFSLFVAFLTSTSAYTQMMPVSMPMRTPMGTIHSTHWVGSPHYQYSGQTPVNLKYRYRITLLDGSVMEMKTKIHDDTTSFFFYAKDSKGKLVRNEDGTEKKIRPSNTKSVECVLSNIKTVKAEVISDSCWVFRIGEGAIKTFSFYPVSDSPLIAFQVGETSPIEKLTKEALQPHLADEPAALELAEKGNLVKAIKVYNSRKRKQGGKR
jgi:hypothetical protein